METQAKKMHASQGSNQLRVSFPLIIGSVELYPTDCWTEMQSIFSKELLTTTDAGKYTMRVFGSEVIADTKSH